MKRLAIALGALLIATTACGTGASGLSPADAQSTAIALAGTFAAETMNAMPRATSLPTQTVAVADPAGTNSSTPTLSPANPSATPTATATPSATPTIGTGTPTTTATGTPATATATPTDPMVPREYGTQPPFIDYGYVNLINKAKTQVYISFECTTSKGYVSITETPVEGTIDILLAAGRCTYVAWVGGVEFTGEFGMGKFQTLTFTFMRNEIIIN